MNTLLEPTKRKSGEATLEQAMCPAFGEAGGLTPKRGVWFDPNDWSICCGLTAAYISLRDEPPDSLDPEDEIVGYVCHAFGVTREFAEGFMVGWDESGEAALEGEGFEMGRRLALQFCGEGEECSTLAN